MSDYGLSLVEAGLRLAQQRGLVLAADSANARTPGFAARDIAPIVEQTPNGLQFAAAVREAQGPGEASAIEFTMGATADNSVRFRALADQERAMLREFRTVAEDARR